MPACPRLNRTVLLCVASSPLLLARVGTAAEAAPQGEGAEPARTVLTTIQVAEDIEDPTRSEDTGSYTVAASTTAFRLPLTLRETPQAVTVVSRQAIEDFNLQNARDILEFTPGVHVQAERNTEAYYIQARGFDMQFQFDGIPAPNGAGLRGNGSPDSAFLDRVEVLHGANGLLMGAGSPGGIVNLVHKTPGQVFAASLDAGLDSFGGYRFVGDVGGPLGDSGFGGRVVAVHEEQDLYVDDASGKISAVYGVLSMPLGDSTRFFLGGKYSRLHDANFGAHYGNPTQPDGTLFDLPRSLNLGADWAWQKEDRLNLYLRGEHLFTNGWRLAGMLAHDVTEFDALEGVPGSEGIAAIYLGTQLEGWGNKSTSLDVFAEGPLQWFGRTHQLMFGVNGSKRRELQDPYQFTEGPLIYIDDPLSWNPDMAPDPYSIGWDSMHWGNGDREQYGAFAAGRFGLTDSLHTILGARVSWTEAAWEGTDYNDESGEFTPYAGIVWDFSRHWSAYASYAEIFQPQDLGTIDASGNVLDPIFGENWEIGLKLELAEGAFNGALTLFRLDQTNLAEADLVNSHDSDDPRCGTSAPLDFCSKAAGLVRSEGVEISGSGQLAPGWQITGGYAFLSQDRRTSDDGGLAWDPVTPKHMLRLALSWTSPDNRLSLGTTLRYQSQSYTAGEAEWDFDEDGEWTDIVPYRVQQDGYWLAGLYGRMRVTDRISASVAVENLFDKAYLNGMSGPWHGQVWGEPRKFSLSVNTRF